MSPSFRPSVSITLAGQSVSGPEAALVAARVDLGVGAGHDRAVLMLGAGSALAGLKVGDPIEVALGYDSADPVLSGTVTGVDHRPWGSVVEALAATVALSSARTGQAFVAQSVGDIVRALAAEGEVSTGDIEAPLRLPAYHVDERRPVWDHLQDLARLAGCETSCDDRGRLQFRPPAGSGGAAGGLGGLAAASVVPAAGALGGLLSGGSSHRFRHGAELVAWQTAERSSHGGDLTVVRHGGSSAQGTGSWHVLVKEPDGGNPTGLVLVASAARDNDAASAMQQGLAAAARRRSKGGAVSTAGEAGVRPGDLVDLEGLPTGGKQCRATAVRHVVSSGVGFQSVLTLEGAA